MNHKPLLLALFTLLGAGCATTGNAPSAANDDTAPDRVGAK